MFEDKDFAFETLCITWLLPSFLIKNKQMHKNVHSKSAIHVFPFLWLYGILIGVLKTKQTG